MQLCHPELTFSLAESGFSVGCSEAEPVSWRETLSFPPTRIIQERKSKQKESETGWLPKQLCHPEFISGSSPRKIIPSPENINNITSTSCTAKRHVRGGFATRKAAFTLAEVLITLGIIGVVAAMTLPTLIANYQKQETISKLQKAYTVLNQALKLSEADNGEFEYWNAPQTADPAAIDEYFNKYWKPYFKIAKICNNYQECGYERSMPYTSLDGTLANSFTVVAPNYRKTFYTTDGMVFAISAAGGGGLQSDGTVSPIIYSQNIWIDINGSNRPNQYGKDFFCFTVSKKGVIAVASDLSGNVVNSDCSKNGLGNYCSSKIIRDGWQIKDDYPW